MGLRSLLQSAIDDAFTGPLDDLAEDATYKAITATYNTATSEATNSESTSTVKAVFVSDRKKLERYGWQKQVIPSLAALVPELQLSGVTPKINDVIIRNSVDYTISDLVALPGLYIFGLERP